MIFAHGLLILLLLIHLPACTCQASYITRSYDGDKFTWDQASCATLDGVFEMYNSSTNGCRCQLVTTDASVYGGTFLQSTTGNYRCYYGLGRIADASLVLDERSCYLQSTEVPVLEKFSTKRIMTKEGMHKSEKLVIKKVQYFTYMKSPALWSIYNPFVIQVKKINNSILKTFSLKWRDTVLYTTGAYEKLIGHLFVVTFDSVSKFQNITAITEYTMLIKILGERSYVFSFDQFSTATTGTPLSPTTLSTTTLATQTTRSTVTDPQSGCPVNGARCKYHYEQYKEKNKAYDSIFKVYLEERDKSLIKTTALTKEKEQCDTVNIILGVICGVLLLVVIVLIVYLCRKDCGGGKKTPESIVIASPSPRFIPPRRSELERSPIPPARVPPGTTPKRLGGKKNPKAPQQPLYESIHRQIETYETPIDANLSPYAFENLASDYIAPDVPDYIAPDVPDYIAPDVPDYIEPDETA